MFSATGISNFLACHHLTALDRAAAAGIVRKPFLLDSSLELLRALGLRHEQSYLRALTEDPAIDVAKPSANSRWDEDVERTLSAMRRGAFVVYQATLQEGPWGGRADFLVRVNRPSALGPWSYEVIEAKLARSATAYALIQLCFYSDILSRIQGVEPQWMTVVLGGGRPPERFQVRNYVAYFRKVRAQFDEAWEASRETYPEPVDHCDVCSWFPVCDKRRRADDHLSLVAGISRHQRKVLTGRGVTTLAGLAVLPLPPLPKIEGIGETALLRIREQARLQFQGRGESRLVYELQQPIEPDKGLAALPAPSPGDVFLDLEGDPYAYDQGLEYLFGVASLPENPGDVPSYQGLWSFDSKSEKETFEKFIAGVLDRWKRCPDMHIYHYASYEPTAIKRLAGQYGTCVESVDQLLRGGVFVDLYRVVAQGVRASVESYSIKRIEALYGYTRALPLRDAVLALQTFEAVLAFGTAHEATSDVLTAIESYNQDDCLSALRLRDWLEDRRRELEAKTGQVVARPAPKSGEAGEDLTAQIEAVAAIFAKLVAGLPAEEKEWTNEQRACWLLAQMLEWHRREEKSAWWEYFRLCDLSDDALIEDKNALGGLLYVGEIGRAKQSIIHRYRFPLQDYTIDRALDVHDPRTQTGVGQIVAIDARNLTIDIKRGGSSSVPHPTALIPYEIVNSKVLRSSLLDLGTWVADHDIGGLGPFQAAGDLLLRRPPTALPGGNQPLIENHELTSSAKRLIRSLSQVPSVLPIQGPPGSGKTYTGARIAVELLKLGCRVGITAVSHKVISNLLSEICAAAGEARITARIVQKSNDDDGCSHPAVKQADSNQEVLDALTSRSADVAAGTAWLWSRNEMTDSVDVLLVDEAGQMSLANTLAASRAATSIILLGDPQQLDQPRRGVHPPGADVSVLAHLLNGRATIAPDQGVFLSETWRLHPSICAFASELFYDERLTARPENERQRLNARGPLSGSGLRFIPVEHSGNQTESPEEVERIAGMIDELLRAGATWTPKKAETLPLKLTDILIVAPYNTQVSALARRLPAGARVGTVDKFQGQQAPLVFYSTATSTAEDAPRGMEFLYSLNRLNVAISRAQCVAVLVANPELFEVQCKTPRQIQLANAFCRYLEMVG